jgi:hypothetical protein
MVRDETGLHFFLLKHVSVDWNERRGSPAGKARHGRPRRRAEEAPARGKRVPGVEINGSILQVLIKL